MNRTVGRWLGLGLFLGAAGFAYFYFLPSRSESAAGDQPRELPAESVAVTGATSEVRVYFSRGDTSASVPRPATGAAGPEGALRALLGGPTPAEQASGISSWFSAETADALRSFVVDVNGVAHVDFVDLSQVIPSASSSAGSELLLRELNRTLFQYPEIGSIEYTINGSCELFWNWLQYDCEVVTRPSG